MAIYFGICLLIIFFTRILAYWGVYFLQGNPITVIPSVLYLSYVENRGAAFGIFQDAKVFLITLSLILFLAITYYVISRRKNMKASLLIPLAMVAGGGISNVADRFRFGFVVDYIDVRIIQYPVFNLADICVVLGVIWLAVIIWRTDCKKK
ncbi:MAG: signal peptidase II [Clostridia bacterium]|nr:signal peptidase II [Clostridia bacterium]